MTDDVVTPVADDVFVLCTDGLTGGVRDEEIAELVSCEDDLDSACRRLVEVANARGGEDNITVVAVRCEMGEACAEAE